MTYEEFPSYFSCQGALLVGVVAVPAEPSPVGVVVVVGGPQYRVGSHRQFVLLARALAAGGIACLRFDYRGMGDSEGPSIGFGDTQSDIRAAIDALCRDVPAVRRVVLWGLCDGAAAGVFVAASDGRICGLTLLNPWVRTETGEAVATLKHYYLRRFVDREFWRKLFGGKVRIAPSATGLIGTMQRALRVKRISNGSDSKATDSLIDRVAQGLAAHKGPVLIVLSENDKTAAEFRNAMTGSGLLAQAMKRTAITRVELPEADHTFSNSIWRDRVATITLRWLHEHFPTPSVVATAVDRAAQS